MTRSEPGSDPEVSGEVVASQALGPPAGLGGEEPDVSRLPLLQRPGARVVDASPPPAGPWAPASVELRVTRVLRRVRQTPRQALVVDVTRPGPPQHPPLGVPRRGPEPLCALLRAPRVSFRRAGGAPGTANVGVVVERREQRWVRVEAPRVPDRGSADGRARVEEVSVRRGVEAQEYKGTAAEIRALVAVAETTRRFCGLVSPVLLSTLHYPRYPLHYPRYFLHCPSSQFRCVLVLLTVTIVFLQCFCLFPETRLAFRWESYTGPGPRHRARN